MNDIDFLAANRPNIPNWAVQRACDIVGCAWSIGDLRAHSLHDSYVYTIWRLAAHVLKTEQAPPDPLVNLIDRAIEEALFHIKLSDVEGWIGTVPLALAIATALRKSEHDIGDLIEPWN